MAGGEFVDQVRASSPEAHQYVEVNQPGRGGYRIAAVVVAGVYAVFGVIALLATDDVPFTGEAGHSLFGLSLNGGTGILLLASAVVVLIGAAAPGNAGAVLLTGGGLLLLLVGLFFLAVFRTSANVVAWTVIDVSAYWTLAMVVFWCGMHLFEADEDDDSQHRSALGEDSREYLERS
jgi:hypothetical protein